MLGADLSVASAALRRGGPSEWPEDAVALWLILGQSNAQGYAPWRQDPARSDPAAAVSALTAEERAVHPWIRFSLAGYGSNAGQFAGSGHGLATEATPRTSPHVWQAGNPYGIPAGTQSFGPEIGLIRHVLEGAAPAHWRDDADPRLYVFKQTEGGRSVDHFRWGGPGQDLILNALRQTAGETLSGLAAAKTVLLQGVIFAIGDRDCTTDAPDGGSMARTLAVRFADWVRQLRAALGAEVPVAFVELETADARKIEGNAQIAQLAAALPNAAVIPRAADWTDVGDGLHYDAAGMDRMGRAFFGHFRRTYGRGGDGLVPGFRFSGLKPWFHVPPQFTDESGAQMRVSLVAATAGRVHARITPHGAPAPSPEEIRDRSGEPGGFHRDVSADVETSWWSFTEFEPGALQDCHFVLEGENGALGEAATVVRPDEARFGPDLSLVSEGGGAAEFSLRPSFNGTLTWSLLPGDRAIIRREDVEAMAFEPEQWGQAPAQRNADAVISLSGLAPGADYTLFVTGERGSDGRKALIQKAAFSTT
jgi:hypothetical protein